MTPNADVTISALDDWQTLRKRNLNVVVDPMVFRSADVFFRGRKRSIDTLPLHDAEQIWRALTADPGSLALFFDQLVLSERLPLIDYDITYDPGLGYDVPWIARFINERIGEKIVETVHVTGAASACAGDTALAALPQRPLNDPGFAQELSRHLTAFDYQWKPNLPGFEQLPEAELTTLRFLYGGLVFGAFCKMSGSSHVLQPKRWRLSTAMAVGLPAIAQEQEHQLLAELNRRIAANPQLAPVQFDALPSVLPHLLMQTQDARTPTDLLHTVKKLRADPEITEYRDWRRKLLYNWVDNGFVAEHDEKQMKRFAAQIQRRLTIEPTIEVEPHFEMKIDRTGIGIDAGIKYALPAGRIWGWVLDQIPGRRYVKVLTRLALDQRQYPRLERRLLALWEGASL